jgi:hypothetical protein
MSELTERHWAVISERGCESAELDYTEAVDLVRRLRREKVHGLCIVTVEAARHFLRDGSVANKHKNPAEARHK